MIYYKDENNEKYHASRNGKVKVCQTVVEKR